MEVLGRRAVALEAELAELAERAAAIALDRIETRFARLRTLAADGHGDDGETIAMERALAAHRASLEHAQRVEGQLTLVVARLLEAGAAATRVRLELLDEPDPARSADDVLARLRQQTDDARLAIAEVEGVLPSGRSRGGARDSATPQPPQ